MGQTSEKIMQEIEKLPENNVKNLKIIKVHSMEEAVANANKIAKSGDIVVLSPASTSFDLYKDFEERGEHFKNLVNSI